MDFEQLVATRRTVNNYLPEKVGEETVIEALRLSLWAPNHKLTFPWAYTLIGPRARASLSDLAVELKGAKAPLSDIKAKAIRETVLNPSHLVALGIRKSNEFQEHEDYATLACSVQIAAMFLWKHGIASKWSTGGWTLHERTYQILGVDPAKVSLEGVLMIGKAQHMPPATERPPLSQVIDRTE